MNPGQVNSVEVSRYPIPDVSSLPDDIRDRKTAVQEKAGFIPNVFLALAYRPKAMLDFAMEIARSPEQVDLTDLDQLKSHGFDDDDILDITGITAFFGLSNHMAIVMSMQPNNEFYTMAREPRG